MTNAAEQIFEQNNEYTSLIWLNHDMRPLIFLIHDHGWWKGFPDLWDGEIVRFPHPDTGRGFAFLIKRAGLDSLLGAPLWPEQPYQAEVTEFIGTDSKPPYWEITDSYGRLLRLEHPGMNYRVTYP